ncbi:MAG: Holliday junction branch migration protein RuvA, partial [Holosporales bacterium]
LTADEHHWFRILNNVQGVGGRVALAILSTLDPAHILTALASQDKAAFQRADGVGPKLALRLVTELKDKAKGFSAAPVIPFARASTSKTAADPAGDAVSALINLGYARVQAFTAVQQALASGSAANDTGVLVTAALRQLSDAG